MKGVIYMEEKIKELERKIEMLEMNQVEIVTTLIKATVLIENLQKADSKILDILKLFAE